LATLLLFLNSVVGIIFAHVKQFLVVFVDVPRFLKIISKNRYICIVLREIGNSGASLANVALNKVSVFLRLHQFLWLVFFLRSVTYRTRAVAFYYGCEK